MYHIIFLPKKEYRDEKIFFGANLHQKAAFLAGFPSPRGQQTKTPASEKPMPVFTISDGEKSAALWAPHYRKTAMACLPSVAYRSCETVLSYLSRLPV